MKGEPNVDASGLPLTITVEQAAKLLGISRYAAYQAASTGELPTLRLGRRLLVPTTPLLRMLGIERGGDAARQVLEVVA
ncbi:MAG: helix-turn-helix domain-containing protein [Actinobacteria bacterium]|nr:helix-turn-helix domain-containing protein [Actinomycetota bacterium]